jgi:hypothetical protein
MEFQLPDPTAVWWGRHDAHGWVVFDRQWTAHAPNLRGPVIFVRCADWQLFPDAYENWKPLSKSYRYAPRYLERLPATSGTPAGSGGARAGHGAGISVGKPRCRRRN